VKAWRQSGGGGGAKSGGNAQRDSGRVIAAAWMLRQAKRGGGAQRNGRGLQHQRRNQSAAVAHSVTAAARWEQRSNATNSPSGSVVGAALERHQLANVHIFVRG